MENGPALRLAGWAGVCWLRVRAKNPHDGGSSRSPLLSSTILHAFSSISCDEECEATYLVVEMPEIIGLEGDEPTAPVSTPRSALTPATRAFRMSSVYALICAGAWSSRGRSSRSQTLISALASALV